MTMPTKLSELLPKEWTPHEYQLDALEFTISRRSAALYLDPGLGKTSIIYAAYKILKKKKMSKGMIVVAPLRPARRVWPAERKKWKDFNDVTVALLHGKGKVLANHKHDVYVVNYEGLAWMIDTGVMNDLLKKGWVDTIVFDELTRLSNTRSAQFRKLRPYLERFERRYGLTGSPAARGLLKLFGQCYTLDLGKTLGELWTHFRVSYFTPGKDHQWFPIEGAEEIIFKKIAPLALRMNADHYMQLPTITENLVPVELPGDAQKYYDEMEEEMLTFVDDYLVTAANAGVAVGKLRQIASGAIYKHPVDPVTGEPLQNGKREWKHIHDAKMDALEELLDELNGQQVLISYNYQHELARFKTRFGKDIHVMGNGMSDKREAELERDWNRGRIDKMFGHPQSIGHGMNLQGSSAYNVIFFTPISDFELWDQYIRRLRRQGNTAKRMFVHTIVVPGTWDMHALRMLIRKDNSQNALFKAVTEYWSEKRGKVYTGDVRKALISTRRGAAKPRGVSK